MKKFKDINTYQTQIPKTDDKRASNVIEQLFEELKRIKPGSHLNLKDAESEKKMQATWIAALRKHGVNSWNHIKLGIMGAEADENPYWPSVGKFIHWCQPQPHHVNLPTVEDAYLEACRGANPGGEEFIWSHEAIRVAARDVGFHFIKSSPEKHVFPKFERKYLEVCTKIFIGQPWNIPRIESEEYKRVQAYEEYIKSKPKKGPEYFEEMMAKVKKIMYGDANEFCWLSGDDPCDGIGCHNMILKSWINQFEKGKYLCRDCFIEWSICPGRVLDYDEIKR